VLSLCDGMACGYLALLELNFPNEAIAYHAVEIDAHARKLADHNLPSIVRWANDVKEITESDIEFYGPFDLVVLGPPCQSVSVSGNGTGLDGASGLLRDCLKVKNWCERQNPNLNFIIENVKMKREFLQQFIDLIGSKPVLINSALVSAQNRERYYWTGVDGIVPPERELVCRTSLLEFDLYGGPGLEVTDTLLSKLSEAKHLGDSEIVSPHLVAFSSSSRVGNKREYRIRHSGAGNTLTTGPGCGGVKSINLVEWLGDQQVCYRMLTVRECARLQTIPEWYDFSVVSKTQAYKVLGNGWTVKVISHILKQLPRVQDVLAQ